MQNKESYSIRAKSIENLTIVSLTSFEGIVHSTGGWQILGWKTQQEHKHSTFCTGAPYKNANFSWKFFYSITIWERQIAVLWKSGWFFALVYSYIKIHCTYKNPTSRTWMGALSQGILWNRQTAMI